jgi:RHS repeat-associated protein
MDGQNREFQLQYDQRYNLIQFSDPTGNQQHWEYDHWGRMTRHIDIKGNQFQYAYDKVGNLTGMIEPDGNRHQIRYDAAGNVIMAKDSDHLVNFSYGPLGVLKQREQHGSTVTFSYDTELQLRSIANEGGEMYRFGLDALGKVVNEWGFDGMQRSYDRDGAGRVKRVLRPSEKWTRYDYDGIGNIILERHHDGGETAFRYDKDGLLLEAVNGDGHILLKRDKAGRVIKETQGNYEVSKKYDPQGNCIFIESNLGAAIQLGHDEDGLLTSMQASTGLDSWTAQWERDHSGLELHRQLSGGVSVRQERDNLGRVMRRSIGVHQEEQSRTKYIWGRNNRLHRTINELTHHQVIYDYDKFDSLISASYTGGNGMETLYRIPDKIGNLFKHPDKKDRIYGKGGKLLECSRYYFHYDSEGNLVFKEFKKNENPNAINRKTYAKEKNIQLKGSSTGWAYEWGSGGMLRQVIHPCGQVTQFWYDALGRRIAKMHQNKVTRWVWDGNVPLHEWSYRGDYPPKLSIGADGKVVQDTEPVEDLITWVFEEGTFIPCAKLIGDQKFSIITDYLGTPTHAFDADGSKVWERELDCYGKTRRIEGDALFCPYMYQGQYEDKETGLYYNRFRYYAPKEGMYVSQDPIGLDGGMTLYGYVLDTNGWVDFFGLNASPETATDFEARISKLPPSERVVAVEGKVSKVAKKNGWIKDRNLSKMNQRTVYKNNSGLYAVDTQHGRIEYLNKRGVHLGEYDIDGTQTKPSDPSGKHNIKHH